MRTTVYLLMVIIAFGGCYAIYGLGVVAVRLLRSRVLTGRARRA